MADNDRREQILTVAIALLTEKGLANVSTRDLAERAGLSRSHIYHYFKDWPTLRQEAFSQFSEMQLASLQRTIAGLAPKDALQAYIRDCLPQPGEVGMQLWLDAWDEALYDSELAHAYATTNTRWQQELSRIIEQGIQSGDFNCPNANRAARQIHTMSMGYADDVLLTPLELPLETAFAEVMEAADLILSQR